MTVRFNYTQDEIVDAAMRMLDRSKTVRRTRLYGLAMTAVMCWLLAFAAFFRHPGLGAVFGFFLAAVAALQYPIMHRRSTQKRLNKLVKEAHGNTNSFVCEVQLTPEGVRTLDTNTQRLYEWNRVEEICPTDNSVDIFTPGGGVVVRNSAFETTEARRQFIDLAQTYLAKARESVHAAR